MLSELSGAGEEAEPVYGWLRVLKEEEEGAPEDAVVAVPYVLRGASVTVGTSAECTVRLDTANSEDEGRVLLRVEHDAATRKTRVAVAARDVGVAVTLPARRGAGAARRKPLHATLRRAVELEYGSVLAVADRGTGASYRLRYDAPLPRLPVPETASALAAALREAAATPVRCTPEQMPIIPGDCVRHVRDPTLIGVVENSPDDEDDYEDEYGEDGDGSGDSELNAFGVSKRPPDSGMLVVTWLDAREAPSWEYPDDLVLLGRYWRVGDMCGVPGVVAGDSMVVLMRRGVVTRVATAYDLQAERDHTRFWLGVPAPATRLLGDLAPGARVADRATGAVGTVDDVRYDVVVALDAGATVALRRAALDDLEPLIPDLADTSPAARAARERAGPAPAALSPVWPGLRVSVPAALLAHPETVCRSGTLSHASEEEAANGTILHVSPASAIVNWVALPSSGNGNGESGESESGSNGGNNESSTNLELPPEEIDADRLVSIAPESLIDIGTRVLFDPTEHPECKCVRIPIRRTRDGNSSGSSSATASSTKEEEDDDRDKTALIVRYRCTVTVMWCDGTTEELSGNDIITDELFAEEEHFFCRGDFVERADGTQPGTIGFVDACDLREKMVTVRWRPLGARPQPDTVTREELPAFALRPISADFLLGAVVARARARPAAPLANVGVVSGVVQDACVVRWLDGTQDECLPEDLEHIDLPDPEDEEYYDEDEEGEEGEYGEDATGVAEESDSHAAALVGDGTGGEWGTALAASGFGLPRGGSDDEEEEDDSSHGAASWAAGFLAAPEFATSELPTEGKKSVNAAEAAAASALDDASAAAGENEKRKSEEKKEDAEQEEEEQEEETKQQEESDAVTSFPAVPKCNAFFDVHEQCPNALLKRLVKEWRKLEGIPPGIYVKTYEDNMTVMSFLVYGPEDTPYEDGIFVFDVHVPPTYPSVPPQVRYCSVTPRLHPNLYENGTVCLSLLGTWEGTDEAEQWSPERSSLYQLIVSVQGLVLGCEEPFYMEPGYEERYRGTATGDERSSEYNENATLLALQTLLHYVARLDDPTFVFAAQVRRDLLARRDRILRRVAALGDSPEHHTRGFCLALKALLPKLQAALDAIQPLTPPPPESQ